ncbi:MAG: PHB depolymerase family esterase [Anaerolineae bacterium]
MWAKRILHLVTAALVALPTFGGALQAQDSPSCTIRADIASGSSTQQIESGGMTREYVLYIPPGYVPSQPTPLVVSLHGFAGNPHEQERDSGWDDVAGRENFIVVYPAGTGSPLRWNAGQRELQTRLRQGGLFERMLGERFFETVQADDVGFIRDLIAHLSDQLCIDGARIYVNGMSNGGGMTNRLACEAADVFAAAGMVAGAYTDFGGCQPSRPIPVIAFTACKTRLSRIRA